MLGHSPVHVRDQYMILLDDKGYRVSDRY